MTVNSNLDQEWLEMGLSMDATYIARPVAAGKQQEATDYIARTNYLDRMVEWKLGRGY